MYSVFLAAPELRTVAVVVFFHVIPTYALPLVPSIASGPPGHVPSQLLEPSTRTGPQVLCDVEGCLSFSFSTTTQNSQ